MLRGKWAKQDIPHEGWSCIDFEDLGERATTCQMCEYQQIRYVHTMKHPNHSTCLDVGCECAGNMSGDYFGPKRREANAKNLSSRRDNWLDRRWKISHNGNYYINTHDFHVVVFSYNGKWSGVVTDQRYKTHQYTSKYYDVDTACMAAFNLMLEFEEQRKTREI